MLAYYPPDARPGRVHKIDVRVTRPGLTVRARKAYVTPKKVDPPKTTGNSPSTPELRDALDSPLPVSGLTMHVFAAPFKGVAPNASVLFGVELRGRDMKVEPNSKILLSYLAIDANGKIKGGNTDTLTLTNLKPESKARIEQTGLRMLNRMELPPGKYQLRIAAHDPAGGNVGSVQYDLEVPDYAKAPFSMSGLVVTSAAGAALPTVKADEQLKPMLPGAAGGAARVSAERRDRAVHRGLRQRRRQPAQGRHHHHGDDRRRQDDVQDRRDARLGRSRRQARRLRLHDADPDEGSGARQLRAEGGSDIAARQDAAGRARTAVHGGGAADGAGPMIAALLTALPDGRCNRPPPDRALIAKGDQSNVDDAKQVLVRTEAEWTQAVEAARAGSPEAGGRFFEGDGRRRVHGQPAERRLQHEITSATAANGALMVRYTETAPAAGAVSAQILTFPYHLVAIAKAAVTDVKFQKDF